MFKDGDSVVCIKDVGYDRYDTYTEDKIRRHYRKKLNAGETYVIDINSMSFIILVGKRGYTFFSDNFMLEKDYIINIRKDKINKIKEKIG